MNNATEKDGADFENNESKVSKETIAPKPVKAAKEPSKKEIIAFVESVANDKRLRSYASQMGGYQLLKDAQELLNRLSK